MFLVEKYIQPKAFFVYTQIIKYYYKPCSRKEEGILKYKIKIGLAPMRRNTTNRPA